MLADEAARGAADDRIAIDRHRVAKRVTGGAVRRGQLRGLAAHRCARAGERVDRSLPAVGADCVAGRSGDNRVPVDRDRAAEFIARRAVAGGQLGGVRPAVA